MTVICIPSESETDADLDLSVTEAAFDFFLESVVNNNIANSVRNIKFM